MSDTGSRTNGVPLPARIEDGRSLPTISAPAVVPVQRGRGRTIGVLVVAAAVRRPSGRVGPLSMGPGGWVSFRGFPVPKAERRRPWWAVLLRAHRVT